MGVGHYLVQEKNPTTDGIRSVWAVQLMMGILLFLLVAGLALPLANLFADQRIAKIMLVLSIGFLVNPFGSLTFAWLVREMRFEATAIVRTSSNLAGTITSIYLAWTGHGAISLAWGSLATTVINTLGLMLYRPSHFPWKPGFDHVKKVLSFGVRMTGSGLISSTHKGAPEFLLGKLQDLSAAGYFSRGNSFSTLLHRLIFDAVSVVATSGFAKQLRQGQDIREPFLTGLAYVLALCCSFAGMLLFLASPLIALLYGTQWEPSANLVRWLAGAMVLGGPIPLCMSALTGSGQAGFVLRGSVVACTVALPLYALGAYNGLLSLGGAVVAAEGIAALYWLYLTQRVVGFTSHQIAQTLIRSAGVGLFASLGPALVYFMYNQTTQTPLLATALGVLSMIFGLALGAHLCKHPISSEVRRAVAFARNKRLKAHRQIQS